MAALLYSIGFVQKSIAASPIPGKSYFRWLIRGPQAHLDITGMTLAHDKDEVEEKLLVSIKRMNSIDEGPTARWEIF